MTDNTSTSGPYRHDTHIGRYAIIKSLSSNAWMDSFLVRHESDDFVARLDLYARWLSNDPSFRMTFERMAPVMVNLDHPHLGRHYEFGLTGDRLYTVEEHFGLPSPRMWNRVFDGKANVSIITLQQATIDLCKALDTVHRLRYADGEPIGLLYRDPIPGYIFFQASGRVRLRAARPFTQAWINGSRYRVTDRLVNFFRPPEEHQDGMASISGDMYALARAMLMMHYPAASHNTEQRQRELVHQALQQIHAQHPVFGRVLSRALDADPTRRFSSAREMYQAIPPLTEKQKIASAQEIEQFRKETKDMRRKLSTDLNESIENIKRIQEAADRYGDANAQEAPILRRPPMVDIAVERAEPKWTASSPPWLPDLSTKKYKIADGVFDTPIPNQNTSARQDAQATPSSSSDEGTPSTSSEPFE